VAVVELALVDTVKPLTAVSVQKSRGEVVSLLSYNVKTSKKVAPCQIVKVCLSGRTVMLLIKVRYD